MKKRVMLALVMAMVIFGAVYASAASLDVLGGFIQAGSDTDLTCTESVRVKGWGLETNDNSVRDVKLDGVEEACAGAEMFVRVHRASGTDVKFSKALTGTTASTEHKFDFTAPYPTPAEITGITVFIEGAE